MVAAVRLRSAFSDALGVDLAVVARAGPAVSLGAPLDGALAAVGAKPPVAAGALASRQNDAAHIRGVIGAVQRSCACSRAVWETTVARETSIAAHAAGDWRRVKPVRALIAAWARPLVVT